MNPDNENSLGNNPAPEQVKRVERSGRRGRLAEVKLPGHEVIAEWQSVGDIGADHVLVVPPIVPNNRRSDDPKPPDPHDMGVA